MEQNLGHYRIVRKLGQGGMGEVYLAEDTVLNRQVAIKTLRQKSVPDANALRRFRREALAVSALNHPNIVVIHEIGKNKSLNYIVSEYVEGQTLRQRASKGLSVSQLLDIAIQIAAALSAAHGKGIIHRDLKPENIIVRPDGYVKVLDFGLAKLTPATPDSDETKMMTMTTPGLVMGTVNYMSPEQAQGKPLDAHSDIFSLGVMLYEMATLRRPFSAETAVATLVAIVTTEPPTFESVASQAPPELEEIILKSLRKNPAERYGTAAEMSSAMVELREEMAFQSRMNRTESMRSLVLPESARSAMSAGVTRTAATAAPARDSVYRPPPALSRRTGLIMLGVVALIAIASIYWYFVRARSIDSMAVMPFVNVGGDVQDAYLSEGLTDTLTGNLSRLPSLGVAARSTVAAFAGKNLTPRQARDDLQVDAMLSGRVTHSGDKVTVAVELADTRTGKLIWNETYERRLSELYSVEKDMARDITDRLKIQLSSRDKAVLAAGSDRAGAYQAYLKGRYQLSMVSIEGRRQALELFRQAIELDPSYAAAYAGLGEAYSTLGYSISPGDMLPRAQEAATKAIALDSEMAEPHATLARVLERYNHDWAGADREYQLALHLNPRLGGLYSGYALYCMRMRRWGDAISNGRKSIEMEPRSFRSLANLGWIYYHHRDYDLAIPAIRKALDVDPESAWGHHLLGGAFAQKGKFSEALEENRLAASLSGDSVHVVGLVAAYAESGDAVRARVELNRLLESSKSSYVSPYLFAWSYAALNEKDQAFEFLNRAVNERDEDIPYVRIEPAFDKLHDDVRYRELLSRIGLPE